MLVLNKQRQKNPPTASKALAARSQRVRSDGGTQQEMNMNLTTAGRAHALALCLLLIGSAPMSWAQTYPSKPIKMIVGFAAGGGTDAVARLVAQKMSERLGQTVVVENRPGAGGGVAAGEVARSPADGYTLLMITAADTARPAVQKNLAYDLERDFAPISLLSTGQLLLVASSQFPATTLAEVIALAKANPGKYSFGSTGIGGSIHISGEYFKLKSRTDIKHIPFKGGADNVIAAAAGTIELGFSSVLSALPLLQSGKVRAIAISGPTRSAQLPNVPTFQESGVGKFDRYVWSGLVAPAAVPRPVLARLASAVAEAAADPEIRSAINRQGLESRSTTPQEFAAFIRSEIAENLEVAAVSNLKE